MAIPTGALSLAELDARFSDALRDTTVEQTSRYRYLQDAYSKLWYKFNWIFRRATSTITLEDGVTEYSLGSDVDNAVGFFNATAERKVNTNVGQVDFWQQYADLNDNDMDRIVDFKYNSGENKIVFHAAPSLSGGIGDIIKYYYYKHITHIDRLGVETNGNMVDSTDYPSILPQFHIVIVKEALLDAIRDKRQFQNLYQVILSEREILMRDMKRRLFTEPRERTFRTLR
jgi:hypothetical protein